MATDLDNYKLTEKQKQGLLQGRTPQEVEESTRGMEWLIALALGIALGVMGAEYLYKTRIESMAKQCGERHGPAGRVAYDDKGGPAACVKILTMPSYMPQRSK